MKIRVRFAPSPTGKVHIGNIRTAIFNYLFARRSGGMFLLRIEDTDLERSTREAIDALLECMAYLGLDYDGEIFYQSSRADRHRAAAARLIENGDAYYGAADEAGRRPVFFRIPVRIGDGSLVRTVGPAEIALHDESPVVIGPGGISYSVLSAKGKPLPQSSCLSGMRDLRLFDAAGAPLFELESELERLITTGEKHTIEKAARAVFTRREVFYTDLVKGLMSKPLDDLKDLIIVRSDGSPVFHLGNVLDDIEQEITHIIRGDDHVENTYRHLFLFHAFDYPLPAYAHLPMIVNQSGKPYSKRDGDAFVGDFRTKGFLPEALFNYLALLGWSPGDDREKMSVQEMIAAFSLERIKSSPAQFDLVKLSNLNGQYIAELPAAAFVGLAREFFPAAAAEANFAGVMTFMQGRTKTLAQVASYRYFFFDDFEYDEKNAQKQLARPEIRAALTALADDFRGMNEFTADAIEAHIHAVEAACGLGAGKLFQPVRLAATGVNGGAELGRTLAWIGGSVTAARILTALNKFNG